MATVITTILGSDTITASRTVINANNASLNANKIETDSLSTDSTFTGASDTKIPSQLAVKQYVDTGGNVNASETTRGIVEVATQAEVDAGTAVGATGASLVVTPATLAGISMPQVVTFTSSGTWTKDAGLKYVIVEVQAVGGAGANGVDNGSTGTPGGGGGAGGYTKEILLASALGATETVTIGVAAQSSFGSLCSATHGANASSNAGGAGGVGSGGNINIGGGDGGPGQDTSAVEAFGGYGGNSFFGAGGAAGFGVNVSNRNGTAGKNYGGGGGGGGSDDSGTMGTGGAGGPAIVIVTEYYS